MDALNSLFAKLEKKQQNQTASQAKKVISKPQQSSSTALPAAPSAAVPQQKPQVESAKQTPAVSATSNQQKKPISVQNQSIANVPTPLKPAVSSTPSVQSSSSNAKKQSQQSSQQQQQQQKQAQVEPMIIEQPTLFKLDKPGLYGKLDAREYATLQNGAEIIEELVSDGFKYRNKIDNKAFLIEKFHNQLNQRTSYRKKEMESDIGKKALKQVGYFGIPKTALKHDTFLPMHSMWKTYIRQLIPNDLTDESGHAKFLKADLHGSIIRVLSSKCDSYEGLEGIVLQEKLRSFRVITHEDKIITVVKQNSVFLFEVYPSRVFKVYGCHLMVRPSDRIKQKFKMKAASEFVLSQS